jgi:anti-sigma B factor antagonist
MTMSAIFCSSLSPTTAVLTVAGELDLSTRTQLRRRLDELVLLQRDCLQIDVGRVTFIDCCCLRVVDQARRRQIECGARFEIAAASRCFAWVASLAGYDELVVEAAVGPTLRNPEPRPPDLGRRHHRSDRRHRIDPGLAASRLSRAQGARASRRTR